MPLRIVQVDAFTNRPFAGNPAAVCVLPASESRADAPSETGADAPSEIWMRNIARWGGGRYYQADNTASIPRIFLREARTVSRSTPVLLAASSIETGAPSG